MTAIQFFGRVDPKMRFIGPEFTGGGKTMGMTLAANGCLYCCPYYHPRVLKIDPENATVTEIGPEYLGNAKWWGICAHPNGKLYCAPNARLTYLEIDPATDTMTEINSGYDLARGIAFHPNGKLYSWRAGGGGDSDRNQLIEFDPVSLQISLVGESDLSSVAGSIFRTTILGKDNKIYNSVANKRRIYRYDPVSDTTEIFNTEDIGGNNSHWGMCLAADNENIYYANHIDGNLNTWYDTNGVKGVASGYQAYSPGANNFAITPAPDGNLFCAPANSPFVIRHKTIDGIDSPFGFNMGTTGEKYSSIKSAGNGKLYLAPYNMPQVLEIYDVGEFTSFDQVYGFDPVTNEPTIYMRGL
ncbi:NHL repeat-containing protein [Cyclobacterium salsum]|uniref:hypothetical protein n=1 Tax=Cyclobacterium salsum TaxID=2666329 RepID=UPI0013915348|nr:hypothetical protein [Cyclobacterium salsum]